VTKRTPEERRAQHVQRRDKAEASGKVYRAKEEAYRAGGKIDKADKAGATARDFELNAATHRRAIEDLDADAPRQHRLREEAARVAAVKQSDLAKAQAAAEQAALDRIRNDPLKVYMEALQHAGELDVEAEGLRLKRDGYSRAGSHVKAWRAEGRAQKLETYAAEWREAAQEAQEATERDLSRERAVALKAAERQAKARQKETARLADLGLEQDTATAGASREYVAGGVRKGRIVSMAAYETLLHRPEDRTQRRLEAMHDFDALCGTADAGLIPEPKFEHESGSGKGPGALVMEKRAAGLQELGDLEEAIGAGNVAILRARIYERQKMIALVRAGFGDRNTVPHLFLAALDAMTVYFKTRNVMAARLAGIGTAQAVPASPRAQASAARR
jgi:hypothetical protein